MICPCCKQEVAVLPLDGLFTVLRLGPVEERIARVLARRRGEWLTTDELVDAVYSNHPDGGPEYAGASIGVIFHRLKNILKPFDIKLEGHQGPGGGRRMAL